MAVKSKEAEPLFSGGQHQAWGAYCPYCGEYWESVGTEQEEDVECDRCGEKFGLTYGE